MSAASGDAERLFELCPEPLSVADFDGNFRQLNAAWTRVLGWSREELLAHPITYWLHPDDVERTLVATRELIAGGSVTGFCNRYRHRDGSYRWMSWEAQGDASSQLMYAAVRDVTEEQRTATLRGELEDITGVGTWEIDLDTQVVYWSPVTRAIHGVDPQAPHPNLEQAFTYYPHGERSQLEATLAEVLEHRVPRERETRLRTADGRERWVRITAAVLETDGHLVRAFGTIEDITQRVEERERLRRFRDVLELTEEGIAELDGNGRIVYANARLAQLAGTSETGVLVGRDVSELLHVPQAAAESWFAQQVAGGAEVTRGHLRLATDGPERWVQVALNLQRDDAGAPVAATAVFTDITELHRTEQALQRSLRATNDGWWDEDLVAGTASYSDRWWEIHGLPPRPGPQPVGTWRRYVPADVLALVDEVFATVAAERRPHFELSGEILHRDGRRVPVVVRGTVEYDDEGRPVRLSGATSDVTEQVRVERAQEVFVSTVSHELRTPLTAIGGALELLSTGRAGPLPRAADELLQLAQRNTDRLYGLIADLLDIEQLRTGKASMVLQPGPVGPVVQAALADLAAAAAAEDVRLQAELPGQEPSVDLDPERLGQVVRNLVSNAVRYAPAGSTVEAHLQPRAQDLRVVITDRGPGVPASFRARAFDRFAQADPDDPRSRGGTGLGLAISRHRGAARWTDRVRVPPRGHPVLVRAPRQRGAGARSRVRAHPASPSVRSVRGTIAEVERDRRPCWGQRRATKVRSNDKR